MSNNTVVEGKHKINTYKQAQVDLSKYDVTVKKEDGEYIWKYVPYTSHSGRYELVKIN